MWDIKLKVTNKQTKQANKQTCTDTDNNMVAARGKGIVKSKGSHKCGDRRRFDFGWWAHNEIYRCRIIKLYT